MHTLGMRHYLNLRSQVARAARRNVFMESFNSGMSLPALATKVGGTAPRLAISAPVAE